MTSQPSQKYKDWLSQSGKHSKNDNFMELSSEPGFCTKCGMQFEDKDVIDFDGSAPFTYIEGRTVRNKYVIHRDVEIIHVDPTCEEVEEEWKIK